MVYGELDDGVSTDQRNIKINMDLIEEAINRDELIKCVNRVTKFKDWRPQLIEHLYDDDKATE